MWQGRCEFEGKSPICRQTHGQTHVILELVGCKCPRNRILSKNRGFLQLFPPTSSLIYVSWRVNLIIPCFHGSKFKAHGCLCLRVENRTSVLHVSMSFMGLTGWGGVGWGKNVHLHFLTYMMQRCCTSFCTSSHTWCDSTVCRLALPHIYDATLLYVVLHFLTYMMQRCCTSSCTSSHAWCYATVRRLALPHIYDATLVYVVLHFLTYMMQRYCMSSCTSSHLWCYVIVRRLALPQIYATLVYVVLHFLTYMMLR